MKFTCDKCNFETISRTDFNRHKNCNKHKKNILNNIQFVTKQPEPLNCIIPDNTDKDKIKQLEEDLFQSKVKLTQISTEFLKEKYNALDSLRKEKDEEIKRIQTVKDEEIKKLYKELEEIRNRRYEDKVNEVKELKNNGNSRMGISDNIQSFEMLRSKQNINALTYVRKYFKTTGPPIKNFNEQNLLGKDDKEIAENAIRCYREKEFHKYIGKILIGVYKKDDFKTQTFWCSDVNRVVYIFRMKLDEELDWMKDEKGLKLSEYIIKPALVYVKIAITKYLDDLKKDINAGNVVKSLHVQNYCTALIDEIEQNLQTPVILKYIASFFKLDFLNFNPNSIPTDKVLFEDQQEESESYDHHS
ncbi:MAG: hypothetical protein Harvfovirus2_62 [Harvfovirus sp.]|uniref:Uncharacterized protein n=1 Tax=Harvfovirus sp. TaxID=2487768 RepID=A0A3G5A056_9VIRU|nr:MAG: hypothetical protein Harvfovirus2_62 [Harvfovirus sp.]